MNAACWHCTILVYVSIEICIFFFRPALKRYWRCFSHLCVPEKSSFGFKRILNSQNRFLEVGNDNAKSRCDGRHTRSLHLRSILLSSDLLIFGYEILVFSSFLLVVVVRLLRFSCFTLRVTSLLLYIVCV